MAEMSVELVAVERRLWSGQATELYARTTEGEIGILPNHSPLLGELIEGGVVRIKTTEGEEIRAAVHGGFLSVTKEGVSVLAEAAELASEIDVPKAEEQLHDPDHVVRARAIARLHAAGHSA